MIAVVIPYFQREPGILKKALNSVFLSEGVDDIVVVVIDDESPVPADREVAEMGETRFPVKIIRQSNTGPGGARNRGLDSLSDDVTYVAFLDSDDTWAPKHLHNATKALAIGYDVYFCDLFQLGADVSAFNRAGRIDPRKHKTIGGQADLHAYEGDMFDQIITGNVIGTPTVVFNRGKFAKLRFRTDLTTAGEDYLFWLELSHQGARFAFGSVPSVFCGKGVNVYAGSGWGTEGHARRIVHELTYRKALLDLYQLSPRQHAVVSKAISQLTESFVMDCLHRARHGKKIDWQLVLTMIKIAPKIALVPFKILGKKLFH